jgi:uncharacterized lipoprotein YmbA
MNRLPGLAFAVAAALILVLAGCGSSPRNNHYLLTTKAISPPTGNSPSLGIGPVAIPEYLNRTAMVYSRQGNQLHVSATERWAEPLESGVKRVMGINLAAALDTQDIRYFPWDPKQPPDYAVSITLLNLDANDRQATLATEWKVTRPGSGDNVAQRISKLQLALPEGELSPGQIAPAYSELMSQLSGLITEVIQEDIEARR